MSDLLKEAYASLKERIKGDNITSDLQLLHEAFPGGLVFSTSFSYEDQMLTDVISKTQPVEIFTLDTGRLFPETYYTWEQTLDRYKISIKTYYPEHDTISAYVTAYGPNGIYDSFELRKECCRIRKVVPLGKALAGKSVWITGLRAEHSAARNELNVLEWDEVHRLIKYNPLLHFTTEQVKDYISYYNVPYNPLHDKGFVSIGCAPCTRAIRPGEDFRAGRWWWEDAGKKECGLHVRQ